MSMIFFYFLKIIFDISTSKRSKKYKPHSILVKKKSKFDETQLQTQYQTVSKLKTKSWLGSRSKHQLLLVLASLTRISLQDKLIKATRITARKRTLQEKLEAISWIMLSKY